MLDLCLTGLNFMFLTDWANRLPRKMQFSDLLISIVYLRPSELLVSRIKLLF